MAYRLIVAMGLLSLLGCGGNALVERNLQDIGSISLPKAVELLGKGDARDEDPSRLYFHFAHEYAWWHSMGSGTAYRQVLSVSLLSPDATEADYEGWPPRFEPLYRDLKRQRTVMVDAARLLISGGHYAQNALDEPAHVYLYSDPSRRLQIAWHVVDKDVAPAHAVKLVEQMAASWRMQSDPRDRFTEMAGRGAREQDRIATAIRVAREVLVTAGFGAAEPGKPVYARGVYVEWMNEPEARFQLVKPLGLVRGAPNRVSAAGSVNNQRVTAWRDSVGWRKYEEGAWANGNGGNRYLPLPGIEQALAQRQTDTSTTLYYYAATLRIEVEDEDPSAFLKSFFDDLPEVERAWLQGEVVEGERFALPEALPSGASASTGEASDQVPETLACERSCFGIDLQTGSLHLDSLRRRLAAAATSAWPQVRAGQFDAADAAVLAVDRDIQTSVMLGAMYTAALREALQNGEGKSRAEFVAALHERALRWRLRAYPEPHTAYEGADYEAGQDADRAELAALLLNSKTKG